ncbi:MAG TPA: hypothetical protein PKG56_03530 [Chitinophagaceae bacterium]|nr:hypothetical protein [Chitinophagaceae bacterium]HMZ45398.1 hypothetical protein [Chitinophagaceae bacterium]HNF30627.1 hypothetical protein [Chitinophagaceae bacterium]HNL82436.1 hypothetical protein [Chitinophagaceae bacterium]HNM34019.1 hypothetical protein [Chitinophagaceae bacterium]
MIIKNLTTTLFCTLLITIAVAQETTTIQLKHKVGDELLQLGTTSYTNQWNEQFTVNKFKYYITALEVEFTNGNKNYSWHKKYHLVDEANAASKTIVLDKKLNNIKAIHFLLGVDSIVNTNGIHTGDLDPMKTMFWTWNTGYIYAKLEGQSSSSKAQAHSFSYHIGGYKANENAVKKISLLIKDNATTDNEIIIEANILAWFNGAKKLKIAEEPICHQPGKLAMDIANNYEKMFSVKL